jgi:hypothetical protein
MMKTYVGVLASLLLIGVGCSQPVTSEDVADRTATRTEALIVEAAGSAQVVGQLGALRTLVNGFNAMQGSFQTVPLDGTPICDTTTDPGCVPPQSTPVPDPSGPDEQEAKAQAARLAKFLRERVFTQENLESSDKDAAIFRLTGEDLCTDGTTPADPICVESLDKIELRIKAELPEDHAVDLTFLFGPSHLAPLKLVLRETSAAFQVDLAQAKLTIEYLNSAYGNGTLDLPRVLEGIVELKLARNGPQDLTLSQSFLSALKVEVDDAAGKTRIFSSEAKSPVTSLRMSAPSKTVEFKLDLGETRYRFPYSDISSTGIAGTNMSVILSGLSFEFSATEGQQDFVLAQVGIGNAQTSIGLDSITLFTADLNELSNRRFDLKIRPDTDGLPILSVLPEFDLKTLFHFAPLKGDGLDVPSFYENETYRVTLTGGGSPSIKPVPADSATGFAGGLKVLTGALSLQTNKPGTQPVTVAAGSCLSSQQELPEGAHPLLGYFTTVACP